MRQLSVLRGFAFFATVLISSTMAFAQIGEYTLSAGYSHIYTGSNSSLFYDRDGAYFDADLGWHAPYSRSPLVIGVGLTGSGYWESHDVDVPFNNINGNFIGQTRLDSDLDNFEIEPRVAFEFWIPRTGIFIKPRIGAGLLINNYSIDQAFPQTNYTIFHTADHTGAAFEVRPALQAGYAWGPATVGLDLSYMAAWGGFGGMGNHAEELRCGVFIGFRF
ncbi:MAG TPA: hypothetical protein VHX86_04915 [Tepidisphaeraceae bacterium]|jgi:hypothetical protein|nr:hypothetical protein [Tepidisphaeraceae bacterium]